MSNIVAIAEAYAGAATVKLPIDVKANGQRFAPGNPVELSMSRVGTTNDPTVYGADLPHLYDDANAERHEGDGTEVDFQTAITYAAFSNYNWIVKSGGTIIEQGAGAGKFTVSDVGGLAKITFGTAPAAGKKVEIYFVTPTSVFTSSAQFNDEQVRAYEIMWVNLAAASSATNLYLKPLVP